MRRLLPYQQAKIVCQVFDNIHAQMRSEGLRGLTEDVAQRMGVSSSKIYDSRRHVEAVETYGVDPRYSREDAVRLMREAMRKTDANALPRGMEVAIRSTTDIKADPELAMETLARALLTAGQNFPRYDGKLLAGWLMRNSDKKVPVRKAARALKTWLTTLDSSLG